MSAVARIASRGVPALAAGAGIADGLTGLLLITTPSTAFGLLGLPLPAETVYVRFVGVFVLVVGLLYAVPFLGSPPARNARLASAFESTALARCAVAMFLAAAVAAGALAGPWLRVAVFDALLAGAQGWLLATGAVDRAR